MNVISSFIFNINSILKTFNKFISIINHLKKRIYLRNNHFKNFIIFYSFILIKIIIFFKKKIS
jgi:hypothetical protein